MCVKIQQTTVAVTRVDILNDITSKILGDITMDAPLHKYWGDMSSLSHRDRRPWLTACTPGSAPGPALGNEYMVKLNPFFKHAIIFYCLLYNNNPTISHLNFFD